MNSSGHGAEGRKNQGKSVDWYGWGACCIAFLLSACVLLAPFSLSAATIVVPPDGPEQMPVLYVKGFNDDGASWARDTFYRPDPAPTTIEALADSYLLTSPARSPSRLLEEAGMSNFAVQWWAYDTGSLAPSDTTEEDGFAFLQDANELLEGVDWLGGTWTAQNRPVPSAIEVLTTNLTGAQNIPVINEVMDALGFGGSSATDDIELRIALAQALALRNNYNDAGNLDDRAEDMLEMLRRERLPGGRLEGFRQVNVVTHSMGSLIARAALAKAADASLQDSEFVSNTIYNAPPWGGSTLAYIDVLWFDSPTDVSFFDDPIVRATVQTYVDDAVQVGQVTARQVATSLLAFLLQTDPQAVENALGSVTGAGVALTGLSALQVAPPGVAVDWNDTGVRTALGLIAELMNLAKPVASSFFGYPARPAADDITPAGGVTNLTDYDTSPFVKQWILYGDGGSSSLLFPPDPVAISADPSIIADPNEMVRQADDTAVAVGSARILSVDGNFPEPMDIEGPLDTVFPPPNRDANHGDLGNLSSLLLPEWLDRFLAPPTSLVLDGDVTEVNSEDRIYVVDETASFDFSSSSISHTIDYPELPGDPNGVYPLDSVTITNTAQSYEYRIVYADGTVGGNDWTSHEVGAGPIVFQSLRTPSTPLDVPFYLEWRSVNEEGGREMIRSASIRIASDAPLVEDSFIIAPDPSEVYEPPASARRVGAAVRGSVFDQLAALDPSQLPLLNAVRAQAEADFVIRNGSTKALVLTLNERGSVEFVWDDPSFTNPGRQDDVLGLFLTPLDLGEGLHTLYYQTISETLGVETRSPIQTLRLTVDDTPPEVTFLGAPNHPLGLFVGPISPLVFQIEDLLSNTGTGTLTLDPLNPIVIDSNQVFSMSETTLKAQFDAASIVGNFVDLPITAVDRVGNQTTQTFQVYYDVTPPDLTLVDLVGSLPTGPDSYRVFSPSVELVIDTSDQGGGASDAPRVSISRPTEISSQPAGEMALGAVSGNPNSYGLTLVLSPGINRIVVRAEDIAGNVRLLEFEVEYQQELFDQDPLELLSPRLGPDACWDANNVPQTCAQGSIDGVAASYHGDVFLFASSGERFIPGDANSASDIFMNRDRELTRVSVGEDGTEADGASTRPAISGDGRYGYFMSSATNLIPGTSGANFYVKDLVTGELAVMSRRSDGTPANMPGNLSLSPLAPTGNGRYVYFESRSTLHLSGVSDTNGDPDIFMVDLDPDGNGDYFDDNYVTVGISLTTPTAMANNLSQKPSVTLDGRFLVFRTQATNLHADLADNGSTADALLMRFTGSADDGTLDVSSPELVPVNREAFFNGSSVTATGIEDVKIAPLSEDIVFSTRSNISGTNDTNNQSLGKDVYFSFKTGNPQSRFISWVSKDVSLGNSSETIAQPFRTLSMSTHEPITAFDAFKIGWVSQHNDIVPSDSNGVTDLFRAINDSPVTTGLAAANWITAGQASGAETLLGGHVGDGRWAWWATRQEYTAPYSAVGSANLYRRRIDPSVTTTLTVTTLGGGSVDRDLAGTATANPNAFEYDDDQTVVLEATPAVGFEFAGWQGVDRELSGASALVRIHHDREVVATFVATQAPTSASASIITQEDTPSNGVAPTISGDPLHNFEVTLVTQPANGIAVVEAGLLYYTPALDYFGSDSFQFQVTNEFGQSLATPATANVTITEVNDPPSATSLSLISADGLPGCVGSPNVVDESAGESFSFVLDAPPANGSVSVVGDQFVYTANPGTSGLDDFRYVVTDSAGGILVGVATVDVSDAADTDGNGAPDYPACMDADQDDLADVYETNSGVYTSAMNTGTDPNLADTDGDGILDGVEVALGSDPNVPNDPPAAVPTLPFAWPLGLALILTASRAIRARPVRGGKIAA